MKSESTNYHNSEHPYSIILRIPAHYKLYTHNTGPVLLEKKIRTGLPVIFEASSICTINKKVISQLFKKIMVLFLLRNHSGVHVQHFGT